MPLGQSKGYRSATVQPAQTALLPRRVPTTTLGVGAWVLTRGGNRVQCVSQRWVARTEMMNLLVLQGAVLLLLEVVCHLTSGEPRGRCE